MLAVLGKMQDFLLGYNDEEDNDDDDEYEKDAKILEPAPARRKHAQRRAGSVSQSQHNPRSEYSRNDNYRNDNYRTENYRNDNHRNESHRNDDYRNETPYRYDNVTKLYPDVRNSEIILTRPKSIDDAPGIVSNLRANNTCIVSLEGVEKDKAQRIADFLGGAAFAFGGSIERVSNDIFIVAPSGVTVSGKLKNEIKTESSIFPWVNRGM